MILGFVLYEKIKNIIIASMDYTLHSKVQILTGLLHEEHGAIELEAMELVSGEYTIPRSGHYYKVLMDKKVLATSPSLVDSDFNLTSGKLELFDKDKNDWIYTSVGPNRELIRVLQHDFDFFGKPVTIFAAESLTETLALIKSIKIIFLFTIPLTLLFISLISQLITRQSLKPLTSFSSAIKKITHRTLDKRIDTQLHAKEVEDIAFSVNEMLDRLQKSFESEKQLFSDLSHELKTPVSVIKAQCDVILQRKRAAADYIEALQTVNGSAETMKNLINNLLSLSKLDSGLLLSYNFQLLSLNECLTEAVQSANVIAKENHIHINIVFSNNITLFGNREKLTEAFFNIIENAIKYNSHEGLVEIITSEQTNHGTAQVQITDTGIGIDEKDLEKIFHRFYRTDISRSAKGTGLGLSIAKAIIETHNGHIKVNSTKGKGSCFCITLPVQDK
jgi:signal transduction histidine kinase